MKEIKENKYQSEINRLSSLLEILNPSIDLDQKLTILKTQTQVVDFLESQKDFASLLFSFESENIYLVLCLLALGQGNVIFH